MAEVLLTQAVNQAEEAIESGNYGGAIEACQRILGQFPEFAGAHRIMGDAYAEQGELDAAREAYQRTLERDPQSIPAHLGLGMLAEDAGDREVALAYFQVAWEIDPRRRDLREHVSRISQQLYGADGRLYLTRAALASLHFHAGRWDRAVSESAQVLQEFSSRIDVQVRLAEALWRRGDDQQARQISTTVLRSLPQAVVPLLILADIHRREGDHAGADEFLQQARDIDPDGVRAADLIMVGLDDQADFLAVESIPTIDDQIVLEEPARYAPAPDFTAADAEDIAAEPFVPQEDVVIPEQPQSAADLSGQEPTGVQPFRWEDLGDEDLEMSDLDGSPAPQDTEFGDFSLPTDEELNQARPAEQHPSGYTGMLDSLESEGMQPFDLTGGEQQAGQETTPEPEPEFDWDNLSMPTDEDLDRARPQTDELSGHTNMLDSLDSAGVQPFDPFGDEQPAQSATPPVDQTPPQTEPQAAPQEPVSGALDETDDWLSEFSLPSEEDLERARPDDERPPGFTGMLDSLESEGMQPFDPSGPEEPQSAEVDQVPELPIEPAESVTGDAPDVPEERSDSAMDLDELGQGSPFEIDWSSIDGEIEEARPGEMPRGYTDQLRSLDDVGVEPFAFESESELPEVPAEDLLADQGDDFAAGTAEPEPAGGDEWEEVARETDELKPLPEDMPDEPDYDSVDVLFESEFDQQFTETEPLQFQSEEQDDFFALNDEMESPEASGVAPATDEAWELDGGLEDLIAEADAFGSDWPSSPETSPVEPASDAAAWLTAEESGYTEADVSRESSARPQTVGISISAERLGLDEALIERARQAKRALIDAGRIAGNQSLIGDGDSVNTIRERVKADPANIDHRIALGASLVSSDPDEALEQFRWVYRNAPDRGSEIVPDLARLIDVMRERETGVHRLLGALYRRHGDWAAASRHYEESLMGKRRRESDRRV